MSDNCCLDCFRDGDLRAFIEDSGETGDCGFCGGISVKCIAPYDLNELFQPLLEFYEIVEIGVNRTEDEDPDSVGVSASGILLTTERMISETLTTLQ